MKIIIEYESKWGNSFLSEPDEKGNRKYMASSSTMNDGKNKNNVLKAYKENDISINTVLGIMYRLFGYIKPLKYILNEEHYLKKLIENNKIYFNNIIKSKSEEIVFLRNNTGSNDQNSYSGIPDDSILNLSDIQKIFNIINFNREELINYILFDKYPEIEIQNIGLIEFANLLDKKNKEEKIKDKELLIDINNKMTQLSNNFEFVIESSLYLIAINKYSILYFSSFDNIQYKKYLTNNNTFSGISFSSAKSFTKKDFMAKFANSKIVYGNPYMTDFWIDNPEQEGKFKKFNKSLDKKNGILEIIIDCDYQQEKEIKEMIENSGVSSFYLGKKGFAYIKEIV